jgi:hypothetical protein
VDLARRSTEVSESESEEIGIGCPLTSPPF